MWCCVRDKSCSRAICHKSHEKYNYAKLTRAIEQERESIVYASFLDVDLWTSDIWELTLILAQKWFDLFKDSADNLEPSLLDLTLVGIFDIFGSEYPIPIFSKFENAFWFWKASKNKKVWDFEICTVILSLEIFSDF